MRVSSQYTGKFKVGDPVEVIRGHYKGDRLGVVTAISGSFYYVEGRDGRHMGGWYEDGLRLAQPECSAPPITKVPVNLSNVFVQIAVETGQLVAEKNTAYGNSFGKSGAFLKLLYPDGIKPDQYTDALLLVRIFDKQMRVATKKDAFGESPFHDIIGYGILGASKDKEATK